MEDLGGGGINDTAMMEHSCYSKMGVFSIFRVISCRVMGVFQDFFTISASLSCAVKHRRRSGSDPRFRPKGSEAQIGGSCW